MTNHKFTLPPNSRFKANLADHLRAFAAERIGAREDHWTKPVAAALNSLADHVATLPSDDPRFFQLATIRRSQPGSIGWSHEEPFDPTPSQQSMLFNLGGLGQGRQVSPDGTLSLLVSAGFADLTDLCRGNERRLEHETKAADKRAAEAEAKAEPLERIEVELAAERKRVDRLEGQLDVMQRQAADLEGFLAAGKDGERPRRVHVGGGKKNAGIYKSLVDGDFVLELGWRDNEGTQHWRRLPAHLDIDEARRKRAQLAGAPYAPEPQDTTDEKQATTTAQPDDDTEGTTTTEPIAAERSSATA